MNAEVPLILCIAGHDPTGGAGIQADIETVRALGGHALSVISALTVQDSTNVRQVAPVAPELFARQLEVVAADCRIAAIKIGLLGSVEQLPAILRVIAASGTPVVFDPVLRAGGGADLVAAALKSEILARLLPKVTLLTPNAAEARLLSGSDGAAAATALLQAGCAHLLVTGGDEPGAEVINTWHRHDAAAVEYRWQRLPETFHGAGCTLASAVATLLARGLEMGDALEQAQRWTQATLARPLAIGRGRRIPGRGR